MDIDKYIVYYSKVPIIRPPIVLVLVESSLNRPIFASYQIALKQVVLIARGGLDFEWSL